MRSIFRKPKGVPRFRYPGLGGAAGSIRFNTMISAMDSNMGWEFFIK